MSNPEESNNEWFCKISGEVLGPLTTEDLIACIKDGAVVKETLIKKGTHGEWVKAKIVENLFSNNHPQNTASAASDFLANMNSKQALLQSGRSTGKPIRRQQVSHGIDTDFSFLYEIPARLIMLLVHKLSFLRHLLKLWVMLLFVFILITLVLIIRTQTITHDNHSIHTVYEEIWSDLKILRSQNATEEQWEEFKLSVDIKLNEITPSIKNSANVDDPFSMELLRAGRDYLPIMLDDAREKESRSEKKFAVHIKRAYRYHDESSGIQLQFDPITAAIIFVDILIFCAAIFLFIRRKPY